MLITLIYSHLFYYKSSHVLCPLNFILLFLYFSFRFDFFVTPRENDRRKLLFPRELWTKFPIPSISDRSSIKSFQIPKEEKKKISNNKPGTKITTMRDIRLFLFLFPRVQDQPGNRIARDNVTTRPFSPRFQFQVASFLPFPFSLSLSLSALPTNRPSPERWKTRWRTGMEGSDEKERMRGNDKKSRKIARKIFQARYLIRGHGMRKKSLNAALWFIGGRLATEGQENVTRHQVPYKILRPCKYPRKIQFDHRPCAPPSTTSFPRHVVDTIVELSRRFSFRLSIVFIRFLSDRHLERRGVISRMIEWE